ncbi:hypothetical protein ACIRPP_30050 [Streptomyces sp. NPDC101219]|uniref:hypothetical protein n=1 Tax=Streptomyces sp. NPDC101219 TaxID=3366131 RepID=UPI003817F8FA
MAGPSPHPRELRRRAVRMAAEVRPEYDTEWAGFVDGDVRVFLKSAYDGVPHLLYYLVGESRDSAMLGCAAAHSPNGAVKPDGKGGINLKMTRAMLKRSDC